MPEPLRRASAATVQAALTDLLRARRPAVTAAYVPVEPEPGGPDLPGVLAANTRLLLPVLLPDGDLDWSEYNGELGSGRRGLREPVGPRLGTGAIREAELIVVPALAVDRAGMRMGRGGGSYDRALARVDRCARDLPDGTPTSTPLQAHSSPSAIYCSRTVAPSGDRTGSASVSSASTARHLDPVPPQVFVVALLHDDELLDAVPAEPHDRPVHAVITPGTGVTLLRASSRWTK